MKNKQTIWDFSKSFNKMDEGQKLDYVLTRGIISVKNETDKFLIAENVFKNALQLKTSDFFQLMKENDFENLCEMFTTIMEQFMSLVIQEMKSGKYLLNNFNVDTFNGVLEDLGNYKIMMNNVCESIEKSDMNCEIMLSDFSKIPSMENIEIQKMHTPNTIYVDILNIKEGRPIGIGSLIITKIRKARIGNKFYEDECYIYSFYQSLPFLDLANAFYRKSGSDIRIHNIYKTLNTGFNIIDLPFQYSKHIKYRIMDSKNDENFCKDCFRKKFCSGENLLKKGSFITFDKINCDEVPFSYSFFTDSSKKECKSFFNYDEIKKENPTIDSLYKLARYVLYMYVTKNRNTEEKIIKSGEHRIHEVKDKHRQLSEIKSFEKWHDLPNIKITKYKGEECDCLIHEIKGTHASPIPHERSGHWRHLKSGKIVWVRKCKVNCKDKDDKVLKPIYKIDGTGKVE